MEKNKILIIERDDNVAIALSELTSGSILYLDNKENSKLVVKSPIPVGHKIAIFDIKKGCNVIKYGEVIGAATKDIEKGELVDSENLESIRGKWKK